MDYYFLKYKNINNSFASFKDWWFSHLSLNSNDVPVFARCRYRVVAPRCVSEVCWRGSVWACEHGDGAFSGPAGDLRRECADAQSGRSWHVPGPVENVHCHRTLLRRWDPNNGLFINSRSHHSCVNLKSSEWESITNIYFAFIFVQITKGELHDSVFRRENDVKFTISPIDAVLETPSH